MLTVISKVATFMIQVKEVDAYLKQSKKFLKQANVLNEEEDEHISTTNY